MCRANAAITDSVVLDDALDRVDGDLDAVGKIFNDLRFEDVRALQDIQMVTSLAAQNPESTRRGVLWIRLWLTRRTRCRSTKTGVDSLDGYICPSSDI